MKTKAKPTKKATKATKAKPAKSAKSASAKKSAGTDTPAAKPQPVAAYKKEDREIPLDAIAPSDENRDIDPASLDPDFLDSIRAHGVLTRLWLWPLPADDKRRKKGISYETIAGERRWVGGGIVAKERRESGASLKGVDPLPVTIYHCTAQQAAELRIIENLHRANLTEIEEGRAFRNLRDNHGYAIDDPSNPERSLVHTLKKKEGYIYSRIKLVEAPKVVIEAVQAGTLVPSVALRVARISDPKSQIAAVKEFSNYERFRGHPLTDKVAAEIIERDYQRQLKGAPFDTKDAELLPIETDEKEQRCAGGACIDCPLRSGNQTEMKLDGGKARGDMCLNPACYARKTEAAWKKQCDDARSKGMVIIPDDEAQGIFYGYGEGDQLNTNCRYVFPSDKCAEDPQRRSWKVLLGDPHPLSVAKYFARSPRGRKTHTLYLRAECKAAIIAAGEHKFYDEQKEERKEESAAQLIAARQGALDRAEIEWKLGYLVDKMATHPGGFDENLSEGVFPVLLSSLCQPLFGGESATISATLERWAPTRGMRATGLVLPFLEGLSPLAAQAFVLEVSLRRFSGETLAEAIDEVGNESGIDVEAAWSQHTEAVAKARSEGTRLQIPVDAQVMAEIRKTPAFLCNKPAKPFEYRGRNYVSVRFPTEDPANKCYEIVPLSAFDGETHDPCKASPKYPDGSHKADGALTQMKGQPYALRGPALHFVQRPGQCEKCARTEFDEMTEWANEECTKCIKCSESESTLSLQS